MVPRKIAFRAWAACLGSQARRLRRLASDQAAEHAGANHGPAARARSEHKSIGRFELADRLASHAEAISGWIDDPAHRGADVDPTLFALVVCYLYHHAPAVPELRRWADRRGHARWLDRTDPADVPAYIERLLEVR
jgi:hypothetical protein